MEAFKISEERRNNLIQEKEKIDSNLEDYIKKIDPNNWIVNKNDSIIYDPLLEVFLSTYSYDENLIKITPNPSNGLFNLIAKSPGKHHIQINDSKGKMIYENDFIKDIDVDISNMSAGIYFLFIKSEYGITQTRKIVKE
jgi:hypothetical protein